MSDGSVVGVNEFAWASRPLVELSRTFADGDWVESKDQSSSGIRLLQTGNIGVGEFKDRSEKARFISTQMFERLSCTDVLPGDILVSRLPDPVGRACIVPDIGTGAITAVDCTIVRFATELVMPDFFVYFTQSDAYLKSVAKLCTGATRSRISRTSLGQVEIPLPSLGEQKRIVAVLDQAFAALDRARASAEANLADATEFFASEMDEVLTRTGADWSRRKLSSLGVIMTGSTPKTAEPGNFGEDIPFITPGDFRADGSLDTGNRGLSEQGAAKARLIPSGSALMVCIGATIGKAGFTTVEVAANQQINAICPNDDVSGEYLYYQFLTPRFQKELMERAGQATLPIISKGKWSEMEVCMPPSHSVQMQVITRMREARVRTARFQASYRSKLADIAALRQSLLQAAFSGQLT